MQLKAPITYNIYDGDKLVFKTKSATKASDYRVTNGKHLSIMATDSIGNTKKLYADGGMVESKINELYKKSKFINDDFNWKLKLLEMIQDNSIEAYNIYQTLSNEEKEQVLQEQYEVDNDMGSYGDGKLKTTKENLSILLRGAKNGKKYANGGGVDSEWTVTIVYPSDNKRSGWSSDEVVDINVLANSYQSAEQKAMDKFKKTHSGKKGRVTSVNSNTHKYLDNVKMSKGSTIEGGEYRSYINNIYRNQSEQSAREGLMNFASEQGFETSDVENALQVYKYDTEENAWGENYHTKKAIAKMVDMISGKYANGGGVGVLEQRIALAKKKSKVAKDGKFFGSEVYLVLQHKTDPEEIFVISQFNYNIDKHNNQWNDYNIVFKTNEYANGGVLNGNYLDTISNDKKNEILKNIANHYGISVAEAKAEVIDADAEMLYEYIANDKSLRMSVYNDFEYGKFADGGGVGEYGAYKVTFQDDVEDMLTWSEYTYANSEQQAISRSAESLNRKYPKYDFSKMKVVEVEQGDKFADGGNTSSEYSYSIGGL